MKRFALVGSVLVIAIAALIMLVMGTQSDSRAKSSDSGTDHRTQTSSPASKQDPEPTGETRTRPELPASSSHTEQVEPGKSPYREFVRDDGTLVRDHRAGNQEPNVSAPRIEPPQVPRKAKPEAIIAVRNAMRPIVHKCAEQLDANGFGEHPRLNGTITISIVSGKLSVDRAVIQVADVAPGDADVMVNCVTEPMEQLSLAIQGHDDLVRHDLHMPFRLGR